MNKNEQVFTPYQQSLVDDSKQRTTKQKVRQWAMLTLVFLLGVGFIARYFEAIPSVFDGWLIFLAATYICLNCLAVVVGWLADGVMLGLKFLFRNIKKDEEAAPWASSDEHLTKIKRSSTELVVTLAKKTKMLGVFRFSLGTIFDCIVDWFLFVVLITVNHPYMAIFHGMSLIFQYLTIKHVQKSLLYLISQLPDPLGEETKTDIDDLMDKLCDPEQDSD